MANHMQTFTSEHWYLQKKALYVWMLNLFAATKNTWPFLDGQKEPGLLL